MVMTDILNMDQVDNHSQIYNSFCCYIEHLHNFNKLAKEKQWNLQEYKSKLKFLFEKEYTKIESSRKDFNQITNILNKQKNVIENKEYMVLLDDLHKLVNNFANGVSKIYQNTFILKDRILLEELCKHHTDQALEKMFIELPSIPSTAVGSKNISVKFINPP